MQPARNTVFFKGKIKSQHCLIFSLTEKNQKFWHFMFLALIIKWNVSWFSGVFDVVQDFRGIFRNFSCFPFQDFFEKLLVFFRVFFVTFRDFSCLIFQKVLKFFRILRTSRNIIGAFSELFFRRFRDTAESFLDFFRDLRRLRNFSRISRSKSTFESELRFLWMPKKIKNKNCWLFSTRRNMRQCSDFIFALKNKIQKTIVTFCSK